MRGINLDSFLYFGYSLEYKNDIYDVDFSNINKEKYAKADETELIRLGSKLLRESVSNLYYSNDKHLVPLSGGSDSRALIALLLEHTNVSSIKTYTFGTPKTFDYEIGNYLADKIGTKHFKFDLTKHIYTEKEFFDVSKRVDFQSPLFLHPPVKELLNRFKEDTIWSGANAGAVVGSFYRADSAENYQEAQNRFINKARFSSSNLIPENKINGLTKYMEDDFISPNKLTYDEQVFFKERSIKHLAPHVLMKGFTYKIPFVNSVFMDFMLSVPNEYRLKKNLYKKILNHMYPYEFALKSETRYGYTAQAPEILIKIKQKYVRLLRILKYKYPKFPLPTNPMINYLDFNHAFRKNVWLKKMVYSNLCDLKKRYLINYIDIEIIWNLHQAYKGNFAEEIITLFTLEIYLKQGIKVN